MFDFGSGFGLQEALILGVPLMVSVALVCLVLTRYRNLELHGRSVAHTEQMRKSLELVQDWLAGKDESEASAIATQVVAALKTAGGDPVELSALLRTVRQSELWTLSPIWSH